MLAKRFFYVSAALFLLVLTYHLGARRADAQSGAAIAGFSVSGSTMLVITQSGDVWQREANIGSTPNPVFYGSPLLVGNIWDGASAAAPTTMGRLKDAYRR